MKFNRILVPLDGSPEAEEALQAAAKLAELTRGEVHLVRCPTLPEQSDLPVLVPQFATDSEARHCETYLSHHAFALRQQGHRSSYRVLPGGPVVETLLEAARATEADVIVMTSHGRSGWSRWIMGSVAERLVREAPCMVLIVGKRVFEHD